MEDTIISMIYNELKDKNLYNYENNEDMKKGKINIYTNMLGEKVIDIAFQYETYTIHCFKSYDNRECE